MTLCFLKEKETENYVVIRIWNNWKSHTLLVETQCIATLERFVASFKIKDALKNKEHTFIIEPSKPTPSYLPKRSKNLYLYKRMYANV